ncbi:hypothetical protein [Virgibacillus salexigens]|uniref:Uncharacterized protein n=1 Tax=Virgibacillus massiliensis TaxID=1462526 RepID=A0A024QHN9_9BACI|nr:hypothetical protein [Virgibacillus massiliensis]CDQ41777.1 hypothetical protein BN990_04154 [Virgibacillus massiliensis]
MIFSYYYDNEKTHRLNCGFLVISINVNTNGTVETGFNAFIEEVIDGEIVKKETQNRFFNFPNNNETGNNHDIDFLRKRFADENKWLFEIRNNKNTSQNTIIGLISNTALNNPIGLEILHDSDLYNSEVRASNLSAIDNNQSAPVIKQTMVNANFSSIGYPNGFNSVTATYNKEMQYMNIKEFSQKTYEDIPYETPFVIEMNLAPETFNLKYEGSPFLSLNVQNVGRVNLYQDKLSFLRSGHQEQDVIEANYDDEKQPSDFFDNGFKTDSKLVLEADGRDSISIRYAGKKLIGMYNSNVTVSEIEVAGGVSRQAIEEKDETNPNYFISNKLDNLTVFYTK